MPYFVVCSQEPNNELIAAECAALTGQWPDEDGFALCNDLSRVTQAAYLRFGATLIASAPTVTELIARIIALEIDAEGFRVETVSLNDGAEYSWHRVMHGIGDALRGNPNLTTPRRRFVLVSRQAGFWFGEIQTQPDQSWQAHEAKPWRTSASLPAKLSRALINVAVRPGDSVLNPGCGTGSLLLEASALGLPVYGADWNPRMTGMSRQNLAHFGYAVNVEKVNVSAWQRRGDVVVADLPYNKSLATTEENIGAIIAQSAKLAPCGVFVAEDDISVILTEAGYEVCAIYDVRKTPKFARRVHQCVSRRYEPMSDSETAT